MTTTQTLSKARAVAARSWVEPAAAVWSALAAVIGALWLAAPRGYPEQLAPGGIAGSLVVLLDPTLVSALLLALGVVGVVAASASARGRDAHGLHRWLIVLATGYAVVFGLLATDVSVLVSMGYLTAIFGPPALFVALVAGSVRRPALRGVVVAAVALFLVTAVVLGAGAGTFVDFARGLGEGLARSGIPMLVVLGSFVGGALWLLVGLRAVGLPREARSTRAYVVPRKDWAWWATVVAALCPLPYGLSRMSWLTPWPTIVSNADLNANPALRLFGLSLGFAAIGGAVLTMGLVMRWGTTYPRFLPVLGGRAVSPTWPTVVAVVVGVAVTVAARSMIHMSLAGPDTAIPLMDVLLLLPFPVWGPLLVVAAIGYYRRRIGAAGGR